MPRVPTYQPQVGLASMPTPQERPIQNAGMETIGRGLQQVGQVGFAIAEDARQKAETIQITSFKAGVEEDWTELFHDDQKGFVRLKGEAAFGGEQKLLEEMDRRAKKRLESVASPRAREAAKLDLQRQMGAYRRQTENFIGQQRETAAGASLVARQSSALDALAKGYFDPEERARLREDVAGSIRSLSVSAEAGEAAVAKWDKEVDALVIRRYLDDKDAAGARAYFSQAADRLGKDAARFDKGIAKVELATKANTIATQIVERARNPETGKVSEIDVRGALSTLTKVDADTRKAVADAVAPLLVNEMAAAKARRNDTRNLARGIYNRGGLNAVRAHMLEDGTSLLDHLNLTDAEYEATLRKDTERKAKAGRTSRAEQNAADRQALAEFRALDPEDRLDVDVEDFGMDWGASGLGISTLRAEQQKASQSVQKGMATSERDFVRDAEMQALALPAFSPVSKSDKAGAAARRKALRAAASVAFQREIDKVKRDLTNEERQQVIDGLVTKGLIEERSLNPFSDKPFGKSKEAFGFETVLGEEEARRTGGASPAGGETQAARPPMAERARLLHMQGVPLAEAERILSEEGY